MLTAYCDADLATCPNSRKSITGFFIKLGDSLLFWKSKKQCTISHNNAEARSMACVTCELTWLVGLLSDLGILASSDSIL